MTAQAPRTRTLAPTNRWTAKIRPLVLAVVPLAMTSAALAASLSAPAGRPMACGVDLNFHIRSLRGKQRQTLAAVRHLGATWVRMGFGLAWLELERRPGLWNFRTADRVVAVLNQQHLHLLAELGGTPRWAAQDPSGQRYWDYPPRDPRQFARYAGAVARRFGPRIMAYKIYNEPNLHRGWTIHNYARLFALASQAIRRANPRATVMPGGLWFTPRATRFEKELFSDRRYPLGRYLNALDLHMTRTSPRSTVLWLRRAEALERFYGLHAPIWVDEFAYPSAPRQQRLPGLRSGDSSQAKYFQEVLHIFAGDSHVQAVFCTYLVDNPQARQSRERSLGIMTAKFRPKPAFGVYQHFIAAHTVPTNQ